MSSRYAFGRVVSMRFDEALERVLGAL